MSDNERYPETVVSHSHSSTYALSLSLCLCQSTTSSHCRFLKWNFAHFSISPASESRQNHLMFIKGHKLRSWSLRNIVHLAVIPLYILLLFPSFFPKCSNEDFVPVFCVFEVHFHVAKLAVLLQCKRATAPHTLSHTSALLFRLLSNCLCYVTPRAWYPVPRVSNPLRVICTILITCRRCI